MGTVEENEDVNCCVSFAFKYMKQLCLRSHGVLDYCATQWLHLSDRDSLQRPSRWLNITFNIVIVWRFSNHAFVTLVEHVQPFHGVHYTLPTFQ